MAEHTDHRPLRSVRPKRTSWAFRVCVIIATSIVIVSWLFVTKDRLGDDMRAMRAESQTVSGHVQTIKSNTQPESRAFWQSVEPIREGYEQFANATHQRREALDIVTGIMKEEINK